MADDVSLLQEIDESLRAQKLEQFWKRFGNVVLAGCVGIVLCTIVFVVWKNHMEDVRAKETAMLLHAQALQATGQYAEAAKALEGAHIHGGLAMLAGIMRAQALMDAGQKDKAKAAFEAMANAHADAALEGYASVQAHALAGDAPTLDADSPFTRTADEMKAVAMMNAGKRKEAFALLSDIAEDNAIPASQRGRAMELMDLAGEEAK